MVNDKYSLKVRMARGQPPLGRTIFEIAFGIVTVCIVFLALSPVLLHGGWPENHESVRFMERTAIYAQHFRHGDLLPIWASSDAYGMGTPLPIFYHKVYYAAAAALYIISGSIKIATVFSIGAFMILGAYGLRMAVARLTRSKQLILIVPQLLIVSHYAFTDWLVRGALAEFSAMMLLPWLLWWCIKLLQDRHFSIIIAPLLWLIFEAHNVTALFAIIPLAICYGVFIAATGFAGFKVTIRPAIASALLFAVGLLPQLLIQKIFISDYNPSRITESGYLASQNFKPASQYFIDTSFVWLKDWHFMTVQIDYGIWLVVALGVCAALVLFLSRKSKALGWLKSSYCNPTTLFLVATALIFLLLQFGFTRPLYERVSLMQFLQFPWRLLAYITPIGLLLAAGFIDSLKLPRYILSVLCFLWLSSFVALSPLTHHFQVGFYSHSLIQEYISPDNRQLTGGGLAGIGEYYPLAADSSGKQLSGERTVQLYAELFAGNRELQVVSGDCRIGARSASDFEVEQESFSYVCSSPTSTVALPISYSHLLMIVDSRGGRNVPYRRTPEDPRTRVTLLQGTGVLTVQLPSVATVLQTVVH